MTTEPYWPATLASMKADLVKAGIDIADMTPRTIAIEWNALVERREAQLRLERSPGVTIIIGRGTGAQDAARQLADALRLLETKG